MLIAFLPALHKGYFSLFEKYPEETLGILGPDIISSYTSLTRDLRVLDPFLLQKMIRALEIFPDVVVLSQDDLQTLASSRIIMPDEDVSHDIKEKYFSDREVIFENVFLRYDRPLSTTEFIIPPERVISEEELHRSLLHSAKEEAQKSADWWRQIGAVIVKDGDVIAKTHNHPLPNDFIFGEMGDPRSNFDAGTHPEIYLTIHAEAAAVAHAAKHGISLNGASVFTSTFPCPNCARLIGEAGIKTVYYEKGYSLLDAEKILKHFGVEIILVQ